MFLNGGFIEGPIPQGNIRLGDIYNTVSGADAAEDKLVIHQLSLSLRVNNLFDRLYEICQFYPQSERSYSLSLGLVF